MFVAYYRVSTKQQGRSGLGLEAQRASVVQFVGDRQLIGEYTEVESGANDNRPQLQAALDYAKLTNATLVVAKLDRLTRNVAFLVQLQQSNVRFLCADMPEANELTIYILVAVAQAERKMISQRTRDALQAAKARGRVLGGDRGNLRSVNALGRQRSMAVRGSKAAQRKAQLMPHVEAARAAGAVSLQAVADYLNSRHIKTAQGGQWYAASVARLLA